ncbi:MAG: outer membrane protein assembly factor BamB [Burkholderiales bacterium]|nr:outer membrane protein assembly factor BamB [Burkholderiales bacterium]
MQRVLALLAATMLLGGCGLFDKDAAKPTPLASFTPAIAGRVVWSADLGDVSFSLSVGQGDGHFVVADGTGELRALRADDGAELWRAKAGAKLSAGVGHDGRFSAVVTRDQDLVVFDQAKEVWRKRLKAPVVTAPLVAGERVFVLGVDRAVHGFDVLDGRHLWELRRPGEALLLSQPGGLMAWKDTLVVGQGPRLAGVDPTKGTLRWEANVASPRGTNEVERLADVVAPMARTGDLICARAFQAAVGCVNAQRGNQTWSRLQGGALGVGGDAEVVVGFDASDRLTAWRTSNGETLWNSEALQNRRLAPPRVTGSVVVMGDFEGYLHFLDAKSGQPRLRLRAGSAAIVTAPALVGNTMLVVAANGGVHAFRPE